MAMQVAPSSSALFLKDKQNFHNFYNTTLKDKEKNKCLSNITDYIKNNSPKHSDWLEQQILLEEEFKHLFSALEKRKEENKEAFWMYCYYCAEQLLMFYTQYDHQENIAKYSQLKIEIQKKIENNKSVDKYEEEGFIKAVFNKLLNGLKNLIRAPLHISKIREYLAYINGCRVFWTYTRLTLTNALYLARDLNVIDKINSLFGLHTDVDKVISLFQAPIGVLNYFSVGLFLGGFIINTGLIIKHVCFPSDDAKKSSTFLSRLKYELYKRHFNLTNDFVWASVNFLTNFNHLFHISAPAAGIITTVFLGFDIAMAFYKMHMLYEEYKEKNNQYNKELNELSNQDHKTTLTEIERLQKIEILLKQKQELEIKWNTNQATVYFVASAAALLLIGFTGSLIISFPPLIVASFFMCALATGMYLTTEKYSKYKEKAYALQSLIAAEETGKPLEIARSSYEQARNEFIFSMVKNSVIPMVLIISYAVCWPVAVVLTAVYIGYEVIHAYRDHWDTEEVKKSSMSL